MLGGTKKAATVRRGCGKNDIAEFAQNDPTKPLALITTGISYPEELTVDGSGNLYVANLNAKDVTV